ncbi:MAG: ABC transporter permease [Candidatus Aerophobetes bacterium]|nr:ABC transporter permease [Candidatus Aerophobetes bacterium]
MRSTKRFLSYRFSSVFLIFIGLLLFFTFFSQYRFINPGNIEVLLALGSEFSIIALGVGMLMICGEFDLSIGSILVFCSFIFVILFETGMNLLLAGFIVLIVGALLGLLNGIITVKAFIPSFITTLGMMMFWRGLTLLLSRGYTRPFDPEVSPIFCHILTGKIGGIPVQVIWFVVFGAALGMFLHFHKFGNWVYATGDNKLAARAMGINTDRVKTICFIIVGILCAFVAMMQIVRVSTFSSRAGDGWELKAIAASVVGGTALMGGRGIMAGIFLGALIISVIENGLVVLRISYFWTYVVFGLVIVFSVLSSRYLERRRLTYD